MGEVPGDTSVLRAKPEATKRQRMGDAFRWQRDSVLCSSLIVEAHRELQQSRVVQLCVHDAEVRRSIGESRIAELYAVEEVECFRAELHVDCSIVGDGKSLVCGSVPVGHTRGAQLWVEARFITEGEWSRLCEASGVKPLAQASGGVSADLLAATGHIVRARSASEGLCEVLRRAEAEREATHQRGHAADSPAAGYLVEPAGRIAEEAQTSSDGKIVNVAHDEALRGVIGGERLFTLQVAWILDARYRRLEPGGERVGIADQLGPGIGGVDGSAFCETLLRCQLQRVIGGVS